MPGKSAKAKFLKIYSEICINDMFMLEFFGKDDERKKQKQEDILDDWMLMLAAADSCRYFSPFVHHSVPKNRSFFNLILPNLDEPRFKQLARVSRSTFNFVLNLIKDDELFNGAHSGKQHPIELQLLLVLYRLGCSGEGATYTKIATLFGVGDGGTIQIITNRVFRAILNHRKKYIFWPNDVERKKLASESQTELPYCIGYVDGTEIKLAEKPSEDGESYFSRKHIYSIKMQCTCDRNLYIRHLVVGYPGSVHDARIFADCHLYTEPRKYFSGNQWIAGDSAYKLTSTVITPFKANSTQYSEERRNKFNKKFSKYRIRIEHCYGLLKERFGSLKELRLSVKNDESLKKICQWVLVCAVLHNIALEQREDYDLSLFAMDLYDQEEGNQQELSTTNEGEQKRSLIMQLVNL